MGRWVNLATGRAGWDKSCLRRSLVAWWWLRWLRVDSEVRLGVSLDAGGGRAHAWLEHAGTPVNDVDDVRDRYPFSHAGDVLGELGRQA